jgi:hypothetical protein
MLVYYVLVMLFATWPANVLLVLLPLLCSAYAERLNSWDA